METSLLRQIGLSTFCLSLLVAVGCKWFQPGEQSVPAEKPLTFDAIVQLLEEHGGAVVLTGGEATKDGMRVLVSPRLQGRIFTMKVGPVESTGLVNVAAIRAGEAEPRFNNFGGLDRFWLGPEAGQFGLYFEPGADFTRDVWRVPADLDRGPFHVVFRDASRVIMTRDMEVANYSGTRFQIRVDREVGVIPREQVVSELGISVPEGVHYAGAYSLNSIANAGKEAWREETGLVSIWILGQFVPSDSAVIIAPFRPGSEETLGPRFNDEYFGKLSEEVPDRFKVLGNAVLFRADARREGKFGMNQKRTTGIAGSIDFSKNLLTIVKFDVPSIPERYANSLWIKKQPDPYSGDALQSYNAGPADKTSGELAPVPFYELESTSPVRPLQPGEKIRHRHCTFHFQGDLPKLVPIANQLLGVELGSVREAMLR